MSATNSVGSAIVAGELAPEIEMRVRIAVDRILEHWMEAGILERKEVTVAIREAVAGGPRPEVDVVAENMERALGAAGGHVVKAAELLRISPKCLYLRLSGQSRPGLGLRRPVRGATT